MKKFLILLFMVILTLSPVLSKTDRTSEDYLKNKKHLALMNPTAECLAEKIIKKSLKKETGAKFKVKFTGYTLSSMKKGIFKSLEITGKDVNIDGIDLPYVNVRTLTDYNYIDYTKDPVVIKSDMELGYKLELSEKSINDAIKSKDYQKTIKKVNKTAYPLFCVNDVRVKIQSDRVHIIMDYNFPITPSKRNRTFMMSTGFTVENGKIKATNVGIDSAYGNIPLEKVTNLINLLDPLSFTLDALDSNDCNGKIDNLKIENNMIKINGKIFVKGEK